MARGLPKKNHAAPKPEPGKKVKGIQTGRLLTRFPFSLTGTSLQKQDFAAKAGHQQSPVGEAIIESA